MVKILKKFILSICALVALYSCKNEQPVYWDVLGVEIDESGVEADITYPYRFGGDEKVSAIINATIVKTLVSPLCGEDIPDSLSVDSVLNQLITAKRQDTILNRVPYQLNSSCNVYSAEKFSSVMLGSYYFTGGANGYSNTSYLNFDNKTGAIIPIEQIIDLTPELLQDVRKKFCIVRDISLEASASEATMFISPAVLPFPKEIGFNSQGVVFFYNLYEVGPRYAGDTEVVIPFDKVTMLMQ